MNYETNIFRIENLEKLTADYVLFEIIGLNGVDDDFDNNIQYIVKKLSYSLKHPVTTINKSGKPFLVVRNEREIIAKVPSEYLVKRDEIVYFQKVDEIFKLDFVNYTDATKPIILRFLQFDIQTEMNKNTRLWQPSSGEAFFSKDAEIQGEVSIYNGFLVRAVEMPSGGFGCAVDITKKYIATNPLKVNLTRTEFKNRGIKKSHLMYQYGNNRYEIRADEFSDLNASQYKFKRPSDGELVTLLNDTKDKFKGFMSPMVANLPDDAAVLIYRTNDDQERRVIAGLCYKVYDTEDPQVMKLHKKSIIIPFYRRRLARTVFHNYFKNLMYGQIKLQIGAKPVIVKKQVFTAPDVVFGNETTLSVRGTQGAIPATMETLGRKRKHLLSDTNVGFYTQATFEKQYFVIPETIFNMYGSEKYFLHHLIEQVNKMHPTEKGWKPEVITYDNRNKKNAVDIGFEILQKIKENTKGKNGGYAVVMLPSGVERIKRQHDDLAALVVSECLSEYNITASIMHSNTLDECYLHRSDNGQSTYFVKRELQGKYSGYVSGVAINQVLLNNERWPYVLNTPLHADLTIGIDVKKQIAGFTFVDKNSKNILTKFDKSNNKEKLSAAQMVKMLVKGIELLSTYVDYPINNIVVHRDGRLFQPEKNGIIKAIQVLKEKGTLTSSCSINIIEIPKHSIIPFRLFEVTKDYDIYKEKSDNRAVLNPQIGSFVLVNKKEAFLCTTGREFHHGGSSNPLYIKYESGDMKLENILEDLYFLSCLAFTKPDDCSRFPITIKITDRRINTLGSNFELEELDILRSEYF
jgi:hypothetical protein